MKILLFLVLSIQTSFIVCEFIRHIIDDVDAAAKQCGKRDFCDATCASTIDHFFDSTGENIDLKRMNAYYRPMAKECVDKYQDLQKSSKCEFFEKYLTCFVDKTVVEENALTEKCNHTYPVSEDEMMPTDLHKEKEALEKNPNLACFFNCLDKPPTFDDNDEFIADALRMNSGVPINLLEEAKDCYSKHQEKDKCVKRYLRYTCMDMKYQEALTKSGKSEKFDEIYD